eukprot:gene13683-19572_t
MQVYRSVVGKPVCLSQPKAALPSERPRVLGSRGLLPSLRAAALDVSTRKTDELGFILNEDGSYDLSAPPPFTLQDMRNAIPAHCWEKNSTKSMAYLARDLAVVAGLAVGFSALNAWWAWPAYWFMQGTMFWSLFVVGHDCGHASFSNNKHLNDFVGNLTHSSILVPYHGWRISHRTHHSNHGHAEKDESWTPLKKSEFEGEEGLNPAVAIGRLSFPWSMFAFPFYLWKRTPGKTGSHYDPNSDLFVPSERKQVLTSDAFMLGFVGILAAATYMLGFPAMMNLYVVPYFVFVFWLDAVTYLHHHGPSDENEKMPWYRGEEWSYFRGGLSTIDRDYGIFNKIHHNIETHVVHHLFSQMPHYNLTDATEACKKNDHYVEETGNVIFYKSDERFSQRSNQGMSKAQKA